MRSTITVLQLSVAVACRSPPRPSGKVPATPRATTRSASTMPRAVPRARATDLRRSAGSQEPTFQPYDEFVAWLGLRRAQQLLHLGGHRHSVSYTRQVRESLRSTFPFTRANPHRAASAARHIELRTAGATVDEPLRSTAGREFSSHPPRAAMSPPPFAGHRRAQSTGSACRAHRISPRWVSDQGKQAPRAPDCRYPPAGHRRRRE